MKIIRWIVTSSADPNKISLSVKSLVALVPSVYIFLHFFPSFAGVTQGDLTDLVNTLSIIASGLATTVSAGFLVYGVIRKIVLTVQGTNHQIPTQS